MSRVKQRCVKQALAYSVYGISLFACAEKANSDATNAPTPTSVTSGPVATGDALTASVAVPNADSGTSGSPDSTTTALASSASVPLATSASNSVLSAAASVITAPNSASSAAVTDAGAAAAQNGSSCSEPLPLRCSDRLKHSTQLQGRANEWFGYGCSARAEGGREAIYAFEFAHDCDVEVRLTSLSTDLDLFMLTSCSQQSNGKCSSTPLDLQDDEHVEFLHKAGKPSFIVVDGYASSEGSYTLEVNCACD